MAIWDRAFSIAMTFAAAGGIVALQSGQARAQADLNIQSRIDAVTAPFQVQPLPVQAPVARPGARPARRFVEVPTTCFEKDRRCLSHKEVDALYAKRAKGIRPMAVAPGEAELLSELKNEATPLERKRDIAKTLALPINIKPGKPKALALPINTKPGPEENQAPSQPTTLTFTFPVSPTYETNATKSGVRPRSDSSVSFGGGFQVTTQGFRNLDVIGFSAGTTFTRYARLTDKSIDVATETAQYQLFLGAYDGTGTLLDLSRGSNLPTGQVSFNTLTFGLQNQTAFVPTFQAESVNLFTPSIAYGWQNIALDRALCSVRHDSFCYYADVTVTLGHTLSDNRLQENTNLAFSATLGDRVADTSLVAMLAATVTARTYENVPGGRNDVSVQIGPKLQYVPIDHVVTSIGVTYNRNYSSLAAAEWHGWIVQSQLALKF